MNISFNGVVKPEAATRISILDKAVWYDFGVYETIKVLQSVLFYPDWHIKRLFDSAGFINLNLGVTENEVLNWVKEYKKQERLDNNLIKICAYGDAVNNTKANIYIFALGLTFHPDRLYRQGVGVATFSGERFMPQAKTMNLLAGFHFYARAKEKGAFEGILIDGGGKAQDAVGSNIFIVKNNQIITPPSAKVLTGVTRGLVIELVRKESFTFVEREISKKELLDADEIFLTSTVGNIIPVVKIDGKLVGKGVVGIITSQLVKQFSQMQKNYLENNKI